MEKIPLNCHQDLITLIWVVIFTYLTSCCAISNSSILTSKEGLVRMPKGDSTNTHVVKNWIKSCYAGPFLGYWLTAKNPYNRRSKWWLYFIKFGGFCGICGIIKCRGKFCSVVIISLKSKRYSVLRSSCAEMILQHHWQYILCHDYHPLLCLFLLSYQ